MRTRIITTDKEIYKKMNMLNHIPEVTIEGRKKIGKIINSINKKEKVIDMKKVGKKITLTKINPLKIDVYYRK